jgi:hypothetical protein
MSQTPNTVIAVIGIDIGKNSFHVVGHDARGAREKHSIGLERSLGSSPVYVKFGQSDRTTGRSYPGERTSRALASSSKSACHNSTSQSFYLLAVSSFAEATRRIRYV